MDRGELERRFREQAARLRRDHLWFALGALFLSVALMVALGGFLYYFLTSFLSVRFSRAPLPFWLFAAVYAALFLLCGFTLYRRKVAAKGDTWLDGVDADSPWPLFLGQVVVEISLLKLLFAFPALIFHFLEELLIGRHLFASAEVEGLAIEILIDGGEKVPPEFLQMKLESHPRALGPAIRLLVEMDLLILARAGTRRSLLRTLRGKDWVLGEEGMEVRSS